jgi:hypothetical protein
MGMVSTQSNLTAEYYMDFTKDTIPKTYPAPADGNPLISKSFNGNSNNEVIQTRQGLWLSDDRFAGSTSGTCNMKKDDTFTMKIYLMDKT